MITKENVLKIAELSKFTLTEEEAEKFTSQLDNIMKVVNQLNNVGAKGVTPLYSPLERINHFRQDVVENWGFKEKLVKSSPFEKDSRIVIPKVIG